MIGRRKDRVQLTKAQKRAQSLSTAQLREFAETYLHSVGRGLSEFDRNRSTDQLAFATADAETLAALLEELAKRLDA